MSGSNNAARIQGAGANCTDGDPVNVCATTTLPVSITSGGGGPVTIADCADVTQGCIADLAVTGDNPGTVNAHLRGIDKILADAWDSVNHWFRVNVGNFPAKQAVTIADGDDAAEGATTNAESASGNGTVIAILKRLRTLMGAGLPAAFEGGRLITRTALITQAVNLNDTTSNNASIPFDPVSGFFTTNILYNLVFSGINWERSRTPNIYKTAAATVAGNTPVWTPQAGKKFRLMRYMITVTDNATQAAPGTLTITLFEGAAGGTGQVHDVFVPAVGLLNSGFLYNSGWIDLGNGLVAFLANNILNVNLSAALTGGNVRVLVCGTEE